MFVYLQVVVNHLLVKLHCPDTNAVMIRNGNHTGKKKILNIYLFYSNFFTSMINNITPPSSPTNTTSESESESPSDIFQQRLLNEDFVIYKPIMEPIYTTTDYYRSFI